MGREPGQHLSVPLAAAAEILNHPGNRSSPWLMVVITTETRLWVFMRGRSQKGLSEERGLHPECAWHHPVTWGQGGLSQNG